MGSRVFIGSSTEALGLARMLGSALRPLGVTPVVWENDAFPAGNTLLERIESLAEEFDGAILLLTPDVHSVRGDRKFQESASNVIFEYGYLSSRLTRRRVALCIVEGADLPSDLQGVKVIDAGRLDHRELERNDQVEGAALPDTVIDQLATWVENLPHLPDGIPPTVQLHGYSGTWRIDTHFQMWRGVQVVAPDAVYWYGYASLFIPTDGRGGRGVMHGSAHGQWAGYRFRYDVVNEVREATVDRDGTLTLRVVILRRVLAFEEGVAPDARLSGELPPKEFDVILKPAPGQPRELHGAHSYTRGTEVYQAAIDRYFRID